MIGLHISAALVGSVGLCSIPMIRAVMSKMTSIEKQGIHVKVALSQIFNGYRIKLGNSFNMF